MHACCTAEDYELLQQIAQREQCPVTAVGVVSSDGRVVVRDGWHAEGLPALTPQQLQVCMRCFSMLVLCFIAMTK